MESTIELTVEKSEELAQLLTMINPIAWMIDVDYATAIYQGMNAQANRQDTLAVLNPRYDPEKSNVLRLQSQALSALVEYIKLSKKVGELKGKVAENEKAFAQIQSMFL